MGILLKCLSLLAAVIVIIVSTVPAQNNAPEVADFRADIIRPVRVADSQVMSLVGNVVFYRDGAVITCDSAIRYSDKMMDCFGNVIINKDSTFIYGDKADYDGNTNTANVYAPIIKMIDKDATLYSYDLSFNTLNNIARYTNGGTMMQADNLLESREGYYYSNSRLLVGVHDVEMQSPDYIIRSDSVTYDMDAEHAYFHTRTYIWNDKDEFLTALEGDYDRPMERYTFTDSSYIMTATREIWADTIVYAQEIQDAVFVRNIQIFDEEQQAMAFGDYAQHWGEEGTTLLTRCPSVLSFEEGSDTIYMRSDSMFIYTIKQDTASSPVLDSLAQLAMLDSLTMVSPRLPDGMFSGDSITRPEFETQQRPSGEVGQDSEDEVPGTVVQESDPGEVNPILDSIAIVDSLSLEPPGPLSAKEQKLLEREAQQKQKEEARLLKDQERRARDSVIRARNEERRLGQIAKEEARLKAAEEKRIARVIRKGKDVPITDSLTSQNDSVSLPDVVETPEEPVVDSLDMNTGPINDSLSENKENQRILRAYRNVRIYRSDVQAVCDSLVGFTLDSTIHLYIDPVMWNENNQIISQEVTIFTRNQTIDRALYTGDPMMVAQVDTVHYNQVQGKTIEAFFREGEIYRVDAIQNARTYYFMEDGDSIQMDVVAFTVVESADVSFFIAEKQVEDIVWRGNPVFNVYPMDKIPPTQSLLINGFKWEIHRHPELIDVFDRIVRPSQRERFEAMEKPTYPLTGKIDADKVRFTEAGTWFDRNDDISIEAKEYIRTIEN